MPDVNAKIKRELKVTFELSERAARWLKAVVQNPLIDDESEFERGVREAIWNALEGIDPL